MQREGGLPDELDSSLCDRPTFPHRRRPTLHCSSGSDVLLRVGSPLLRRPRIFLLHGLSVLGQGAGGRLVVLAAAGLRVPDPMTKAGAVLELRYARERMELHVLHLRRQSVLDLRAE
jgi:hypothetical protein